MGSTSGSEASTSASGAWAPASAAVSRQAAGAKSARRAAKQLSASSYHKPRSTVASSAAINELGWEESDWRVPRCQGARGAKVPGARVPGCRVPGRGTESTVPAHGAASVIRRKLRPQEASRRGQARPARHPRGEVVWWAVSPAPSEGQIVLNLAEFATGHAQVADELARRPAKEAFADQRGRFLRGVSDLIAEPKSREAAPEAVMSKMMSQSCDANCQATRSLNVRAPARDGGQHDAIQRERRLIPTRCEKRPRRCQICAGRGSLPWQELRRRS